MKKIFLFLIGIILFLPVCFADSPTLGSGLWNTNYEAEYDVYAHDDVISGDDMTCGDDLTVTGNTFTWNGVAYTAMPDNGDAGEQLQTDGNGGLTWEAAASPGATAWDDIGDPDADGTVAFAGYKQTLSSTLNSAGCVLNIYDSTADLTADVSLLDLLLKDNGDANGFFLRCYDNSSGDLMFMIGPNGAVTITGTAEGTNALTITGGDITLTDGDVVLSSGDLSVTGNVTISGSFYQSAIAAAAAGNVNLTIDAAGNGTITIGSISTGATIFSGAVQQNGNVDIGNAGTDTLTITSIIDGDVTLDDGVTHSPQLILKDATDETCAIQKTDGDDVLVTIAGGRDFEIVTGNLAIGNGSPGTAPMDGEDFYCEGASEFDAAMQVDGAATFAADVVINDQIAVTLGDNTEEILVTASATDWAADSSIVTFTNGAGAGETNNTYILRLRNTANGDAQDHFLVAEDNAGDDKFAINSGGTVISTLDEQAYVMVDADTTANTSTGGIVDWNFKSATASNVGVHMDYELDNGGSGTQYGIVIDLDDDAAGGDETFQGITLKNSNGTDATFKGIVFENTINNAITATLPAAGTFTIVDAATTDSTVTTGVEQITYDTITNTAYYRKVDMGVADPAGTIDTGYLYIDLDDDTNTQAAVINGVRVNSGDLTGNAASIVQAFYATGVDCALQADNGYVRIGTGSTPDVTPGDDDLYVEGTAEIDGATRFDGAITVTSTITMDGGDAFTGFKYLVTDDADDEILTVGDSGGVFTNAGDADGQLYSLPDAAAGLTFTFIVMAAQQLKIDPQAGDKIIYAGTSLDNGEYIWADAVGESMTLIAVDGVNWIVTTSVGTWTQETP